MKEHGLYDLENFHIVVYNIPKEEIIIHKRELLFPKYYSSFFLRTCIDYSDKGSSSPIDTGRQTAAAIQPEELVSTTRNSGEIRKNLVYYINLISV